MSNSITNDFIEIYTDEEIEYIQNALNGNFEYISKNSFVSSIDSFSNRQNERQKKFCDNIYSKAFFGALNNSDINIIYYLISNRLVDINSHFENNESPLLFSASRSLNEMAIYLIENTSCNTYEVSEQTQLNIFGIAIRNNNIDLIRYLCKKKLFSITENFNEQSSYLDKIIELNGFKEAFEIVLSSHDQYSIDNIFKLIGFIISNKKYSDNLIDNLLIYFRKLKIEWVNDIPRDPNVLFKKSLEENHLITIKILLITSLIKSDEKDSNGDSILIQAIRRKNYELVKFLIDNEFSKINEKDSTGRIALEIANEIPTNEAIFNYLFEQNKKSSEINNLVSENSANLVNMSYYFAQSNTTNKLTKENLLKLSANKL